MRTSPPTVSLPMIFALAAGLVLIAVPLHLWRNAPRPPAPAAAYPPAPEVPKLQANLLSEVVPPPELVMAAVPRSRVKLSPFDTIRCVRSGPERTPPDRCDHLQYFEEALAEAIHDQADIGPSTIRGAVVSFVMDIDFRRRQVKVFRGKSSSVPEQRTAELFRRVREAMPTPAWHTIKHQHRRYVVYVKASYPPSKTF